MHPLSYDAEHLVVSFPASPIIPSRRQFPDLLKEGAAFHTESAAYQIVDIDTPTSFKYTFAYLCSLDTSQPMRRHKEFREYLERAASSYRTIFADPHLNNLCPS